MLIDLEEIIKKYNLNLRGVIHVGGHVGEEIKLYKKHTDKIHIFEPLEECFNKIPNGVNKYLCALGSKNQKKRFLCI